MHCWKSCEWMQPMWKAICYYPQRALKECMPFDPAIPLLGLYFKVIKRKGSHKNIYSKVRDCSSVGEWLNKLCYLMVMEYYCTERNDEPEDF